MPFCEFGESRGQVDVADPGIRLGTDDGTPETTEGRVIAIAEELERHHLEVAPTALS